MPEQVFTAIVQYPGITRSQLHSATHRRFKADEIAEALASLEAQGKVRSESEATGGRNAEVWFASKKACPRSEVMVEEIPVADAGDLAGDTYLQTPSPEPEPEPEEHASASPGGEGMDCTVPANATPWWGIPFQGQQCINGVPLCEINRQAEPEPDAFIAELQACAGA
ncbi:MAG: hypothetical protein JNM56_04905 [Planctomycetia bacterium]|nr:hypothetical protein [Planctomycetia bacterium]